MYYSKIEKFSSGNIQFITAGHFGENCSKSCKKIGKICSNSEIKKIAVDNKCSAQKYHFGSNSPCLPCSPSNSTNRYCFPGKVANNYYYNKTWVPGSYTCDTIPDRTTPLCPCEGGDDLDKMKQISSGDPNLSVTPNECKEYAKSKHIKSNISFNNRFNPKGCFHHKESNTVYYNHASNGKQCGYDTQFKSHKICIEKPGSKIIHNPVKKENSRQKFAKQFPKCAGFKPPLFQHIPNAAISGRNTKHLNNVKVSDCKSACLSKNWCNSFDYYKRAKKCDLSNAPISTPLKTNYRGNPYDHYRLILKKNGGRHKCFTFADVRIAKAEADRQKAAREKAAREKAAREKAAREKAAREKAAREEEIREKKQAELLRKDNMYQYYVHNIKSTEDQYY